MFTDFIHLSHPMECLIPRDNYHVNYELWVTMIYPGGSLNEESNESCMKIHNIWGQCPCKIALICSELF